MRISKTLVAFCAIALCAVLIGNAATDTEAQAKAREALRKKLAEEGQTVPETPAVAPAAPSAPSAPAPAVSAVDPSASKEEQLRRAMRQKILELNQQNAPAVAPAPAVVTPAPVVPPAPVVTSAPVATVNTRPTSSLDPAKEEQLRQAVRQKIGELNQPGVGAGTASTPVVATESPKVSDEQVELMRKQMREKIAEEQAREQAARLVAPPQPAVTEPPSGPSAAEQRRFAAEEKARKESEQAAARAVAQEQRRAEAAAKAEVDRQAAARKKPPTEASLQPGAAGFAPIAAPPSGLPGSKEARLAELTRRYKADQITPEEYHTERAKLIAEP